MLRNFFTSINSDEKIPMRRLLLVVEAFLAFVFATIVAVVLALIWNIGAWAYIIQEVLCLALWLTAFAYEVKRGYRRKSELTANILPEEISLAQN
jgi:hypothetical protein